MSTELHSPYPGCDIIGACTQVRFARENNKVQPTTEPNDKNMLFFARAPPKATEEDIKTAFAEHGEASLPIPLSH